MTYATTVTPLGITKCLREIANAPNGQLAVVVNPDPAAPMRGVGIVTHRPWAWAFGAVFYEILTGRPLFQGETVSDILVEVLP